jgi:hypothetical protein
MTPIIMAKIGGRRWLKPLGSLFHPPVKAPFPLVSGVYQASRLFLVFEGGRVELSKVATV